MTEYGELIDYYGYQMEIWNKSYQMMGLLLDKNFVMKEVEKRNLSDIYIYGGGYLGIQLYQAIKPYVNVLSVVDQRGELRIKNNDIPVMDIDTFRKQYNDATVIITPIQYYREIYHELLSFIADDKIIFLEEFGR